MVTAVIDYSINPTTYLDGGFSIDESPTLIILLILILLPGFSLSVRRLRDINKSWLWAILFLVAECVVIFHNEEEFLESVDFTMMDYFVTSSLVIWIWSIYWLGFKKSK
jgi:uncharacterized membrane protein YhaH (DUF805 family)